MRPAQRDAAVCGKSPATDGVCALCLRLWCVNCEKVRPSETDAKEDEASAKHDAHQELQERRQLWMLQKELQRLSKTRSGCAGFPCARLSTLQLNSEVDTPSTVEDTG